MSDANWSTRIECVAVTCDGCSCCSRKTSSLDIISLRKSQNRFWKFESRPQSGHYITLSSHYRVSRHHSELLIPPGLRTSGGIILATSNGFQRWWDGTRQPLQLDMVQRCPEFLNCQMFKIKSVLRPRPSTAVSCSFHMATVTNSDHLHWGS